MTTPATRSFGEQLDDTGLATWARPNGGCFIALTVLDGCAREVVRLAAEPGITATPAGATHPYGITVRVRRAGHERLIAQQN
ncbi:hypothetical protein AB0M05_19585 [Streptomyces violaceusniger]|uniref:hypothetical protein n=1 Tax=Streptomyces violaceusniger TaxID=68280 RepID=UPI0034278FA7